MKVRIIQHSIAKKFFFGTGSTRLFAFLIAAIILLLAQHAYGHQLAEPGKLDPSYFTASISATKHVNNNGGSNGSIEVSTLGGVAPYSYAINGGAYQSANTFTDLVAGFYLVSVVDAKGNTFQLRVVINQPYNYNAASE